MITDPEAFVNPIVVAVALMKVEETELREVMFALFAFTAPDVTYVDAYSVDPDAPVKEK